MTDDAWRHSPTTVKTYGHGIRTALGHYQVLRVALHATVSLILAVGAMYERQYSFVRTSSTEHGPTCFAWRQLFSWLRMLSQFAVALQELRLQLAREKQAVATAQLPANIGHVAKDLQTQLAAVEQELEAEQQRHKETRQTAASLQAQLQSPCVLQVNLTSILSAYVGLCVPTLLRSPSYHFS